ncbi:CAP domain-containing protein [Paenibacillus sp. GCM10023250]|uniref:CAP domain-containing protein n=1 Tax=Paenibacillus sp. GCM10023250 TaxID=3252648 RepID=UPI003609B528
MKRFFGTLLGIVLAFGVGALIYNSVRGTAPNGTYHSASKEAQRIRTNSVDRLPMYARTDRPNNVNVYDNDRTLRARGVDVNPLNDWLRQLVPGVYNGTTGNTGNRYYNGNTGNTGNYQNPNAGTGGGTGTGTGTGTSGSGAGTVDSSIASQILQKVNAERSKAGVQPLSLSAELNKVAQAKSADMRDKGYFDHQSPTYGSPFDMMKSFGVSYSYAGENIAAGQQDVQAVMTAWMNSPGHRQNILSPNYTKLGVGYAKGGSMNPYWTQEFIRP